VMARKGKRETERGQVLKNESRKGKSEGFTCPYEKPGKGHMHLPPIGTRCMGGGGEQKRKGCMECGGRKEASCGPQTLEK